MPNTIEALASKNYAIMRVERIRELGEMRRIELHNTREKLSENVEPDGPEPRELIPVGPPDVLDRAHDRMAECGLDIKKVEGAVGVEVVLTTSHAWWLTATEQMKQDWIDANIDWLNQKFGRALLSAKLHEDEKTPHIHAVALAAVCKIDGVRGPKPKTEEGWARRRAEEAKRKPCWRWNYRDLFGSDFDQLSLEQDRYHAAVAHLGLHRGERGQVISDMEIHDGVVVPATQLSRGKRSNGTDRPRRRITTKQYQAAARDDRKLAVEQRRRADQELEAAAAARCEAEQNASATAAARALAENIARVAEEDRLIASAEHSRAKQLRLNLEADIASKTREAEELTLAAEADRVAAKRIRNETEAATASVEADRERAAVDALLQARARRQAEDALAAAESDRITAAAELQRIDESRSLHERQAVLLARAADDRNGLDLRISGTSFAMKRSRMTEDERAATNKPWPSFLVAMARALAFALARLRQWEMQLAAQKEEVLAREKAATDKQSGLEHDRMAHEAQVAQHLSVVADLDRRRVKVEEDEARANAAVASAHKTLAAAQAAEANAKSALSSHTRWTRAVTALAPHPDWIEVDENARMRLHAAVEGTAPPELIATLSEAAPSWVISLVTQQKELAEARQRADERELQAAYATERLLDMIKEAGPVLTPTQQTVASDAAKIARNFGISRNDRSR